MKSRMVVVGGETRRYELIKFEWIAASEESITPGDMKTREQEVLGLADSFGVQRIDRVFPEYGTLPYSFLHTTPLIGNYTTDCGQDEFAKMRFGFAEKWSPPTEMLQYFAEIRTANPKTFKLDQALTCLRGISAQNGVVTLSVGSGLYSDSFYSNGSEGAIVTSQQRTLRSLVWEQYGGIPPLDACVYNNNIGNGVIVLTEDNFFVFILRGKNVSINKGINCTASGATQWNASTLEKGIQFHLAQEMVRETNEELGFTGGAVLLGAMQKRMWLELGLSPGSYDLIPVGFIRELPRGGKPELLFLADFKGALRDVLGDIFSNTNREKQEIEGVYAQHMHETDAMLRDSRARNIIQHKGRTNLLLAHHYLSLKSRKDDNNVKNG